jgi:hypothetical protein
VRDLKISPFGRNDKKSGSLPFAARQLGADRSIPVEKCRFGDASLLDRSGEFTGGPLAQAERHRARQAQERQNPKS